MRRAIPGGAPSYYHFSLKESHFDPCAPISWDILVGTLSSQKDAPGATAGSNMQTVIFFTHGDMADQPNPPLTATVDAVTLTSPTTVAASFKVDKSARAAADYLLLTNHYTLDGTTLTPTSEQISQAPDPVTYLNLTTLDNTNH